MAPFRWPNVQNDLALAKEVATRKPDAHTDWEQIASILSQAFSTTEKNVERSWLPRKDKSSARQACCRRQKVA